MTHRCVTLVLRPDEVKILERLALKRTLDHSEEHSLWEAVLGGLQGSRDAEAMRCVYIRKGEDGQLIVTEERDAASARAVQYAPTADIIARITRRLPIRGRHIQQVDLVTGEVPLLFLTEKQQASVQNDNICPDCGAILLEGPHGGRAINRYCTNDSCQKKFNDMGPLGVHRIPEVPPDVRTDQPKCDD